MDILTYSEIRSLTERVRSLILRPIFLSAKNKNPMITPNSTILAISVPRAAPLTPISGAPSLPKINIQLQKIFIKNEQQLEISGTLAFPTLLSMILEVTA